MLQLFLFSIPILISCLTLAAMHWFPWDLSRLQAYAAGTAVLIGVPALAMLVAAGAGLDYSPLFWAALLVVNALAGGATVAVAYWIDGRRVMRPVDLGDIDGQQ